MEDYDESFAALHARAYRTAFRILGEREEAMDAAQETLARAYARWSKVRDYAEPWVCRVAANLALDVVRRRARQLPRIQETGEPAYLDERVDLQRALRGLPRRQREVVVLRYVADFPEADVAAALGVSVGSVKTHASRGLAALRAGLTGA